MELELTCLLNLCYKTTAFEMNFSWFFGGVCMTSVCGVHKLAFILISTWFNYVLFENLNVVLARCGPALKKPILVQSPAHRLFHTPWHLLVPVQGTKNHSCYICISSEQNVEQTLAESAEPGFVKGSSLDLPVLSPVDITS